MAAWPPPLSRRSKMIASTSPSELSIADAASRHTATGEKPLNLIRPMRPGKSVAGDMPQRAAVHGSGGAAGVVAAGAGVDAAAGHLAGTKFTPRCLSLLTDRKASVSAVANAAPSDILANSPR